MSVELPKHLQREIMSRLPLKSLMKFKCVSKNWETTIREKHFEALHFLQSKTRPRVLFAFCRYQDFLFHSVYQEEEPSLSSGQQQVRISNEPFPEISAPIRGLFCLQSSAKVVICNPGKRKFRILPDFGEHKVYSIESSFGYDEVTKVFKVLCTTLPIVGKYLVGLEHYVITVGSGEESWRTIECKLLHRRVTSSLCIGGVIYYGASLLGNHKSVVMSFNVATEEFTVIDLPTEVTIRRASKLVNFKGDIALVNDSVNEIGVFKMLVRNQVEGEWRTELVEIPRWRHIVGDMEFSFEGTIGKEVVVFSLNQLLDDGSHFVVYYNTVTKDLRKFKVEGGVGSSYLFARTFLDHVDSLFL